MTIQQIEFIAIIAAIGAFWNQAMALLEWPRSWLVVHRETDGKGGKLLLQYLLETAKSKPHDSGSYVMEHSYIKSVGRVAVVWFENMLRGPQLFWIGWVPIWFRPASERRESPRFSYIKGTLDWDVLLRQVVDWDLSVPDRGEVRFKVNSHGDLESSNGEVIDSDDIVDSIMAGKRILHWNVEDIGVPPALSLDRMSLRPEAVKLAKDIKRFIELREWFNERSIPWRRGWFIPGPPGSGKTTFVRSIAVEHDLPVHELSLGEMDNRALRRAWAEAVADTPCIVLIEDIDAIYHGRTLISKKGPSFDTLLRCIGGITTCNGLLLFVTSNRPESIDPALLRGGRLDMRIDFNGMDRPGRVKMATRILKDPIEAESVSDNPEFVRLSPADFQERLCRIAVARQFGDEPYTPELPQGGPNSDDEQGDEKDEPDFDEEDEPDFDDDGRFVDLNRGMSPDAIELTALASKYRKLKKARKR